MMVVTLASTSIPKTATPTMSVTMVTCTTSRALTTSDSTSNSTCVTGLIMFAVDVSVSTHMLHIILQRLFLLNVKSSLCQNFQILAKRL